MGDRSPLVKSRAHIYRRALIDFPERRVELWDQDSQGHKIRTKINPKPKQTKYKTLPRPKPGENEYQEQDKTKTRNQIQIQIQIQ